jgi:hypothetical protein
MSPKVTNDDCVAYARECTRLAGLVENHQIRERLMSREWMAVAMGEEKMPEATAWPEQSAS